MVNEIEEKNPHCRGNLSNALHNAPQRLENDSKPVSFGFCNNCSVESVGYWSVSRNIDHY